VSEQKANAQIKSAQLHIVVTRADGTVEDHGVVAHYDSNPFKRLWWRLTRKVI
jgi:hypothetical protein